MVGIFICEVDSKTKRLECKRFVGEGVPGNTDGKGDR
jgi:hypothetical protein